MIKNVLQIGNPLLLERSEEITIDEFNTEPLRNLIADMVDTMRDKSGVGISAIQIGVKKRITIIEYDASNSRYQDIGNCPLTVIINPEIKPIGDELSEYNEGCLSVPDERGIILRPKHISYKYYTIDGTEVVGESDTFFARVMQHEIDHMDGILFPMRISNKFEKV